MLMQREIEELSDIALGSQPVGVHATQFWDVQPQGGAVAQKPEEQKDMLDFLKSGQPVLGTKIDKQQTWSVAPQSSQVPTTQVGQPDSKIKQDDQWKQDPRIQALIANQMQQIEIDIRNKSTQGKRKHSGRFNITDNSTNASYRRWPNEAILVGPNKKRVTFDELSQTQVILGFVKM